MNHDDEVCLCFHVSLRKIRAYMKRENPPVASLISVPFQFNAAFGEEGLHQQHRAEGQEQVLAKEQPDIVRSRSQRARLLALYGIGATLLLFRGGFGHWRHQRTHHLRVTTQAGQTERRRGLAQGQISEQQTTWPGPTPTTDQTFGQSAQTMSLDLSNHR